nr:hypothetical protein [Tanacetum cinerariifolium]
MDRLPKNAIGLYHRFFKFSCVRGSFSTLLLGIIKHFRVRDLGGKIFHETFSDRGSLAGSPRVLFTAGLATVREFPNRHPVFKDIKGDDYLRSGYSVKGVNSTEKKRVQTAKADARKKKNKKRPDEDGEGSLPKLKRRKSKASNYSYKEEEVHELFQKPPSKIVPETQENNLELVHMSSNESANESIHDFIEEEHERPPAMDPFVNLVEISLEVKRDNLFVNDSKADDANHPRVSLPELFMFLNGRLSKCRVDTLEKCHEMMIHLATSVVQEDHNALPSRIALERAWFTLGRVAELMKVLPDPTPAEPSAPTGSSAPAALLSLQMLDLSFSRSTVE